MQQTYEIYVVPPCSCDADWRYLGVVQAVSQDSALDETARRWPEEERGKLVAELVDEGVYVHLMVTL